MKAQEAIKKQEYVDFESFLRNFRFWASLRHRPVLLMSSKHCIPAIASLWNCSKYGSDVAAGIMQGSWHTLSIQLRRPSAMVMQRIPLLILIDVMKMSTFLSLKSENAEIEDINKFRNKSNQIFESHRVFLLHVRKTCILPMMTKEKNSVNNAFTVAIESNNTNPAAPTSNSSRFF